MAFEHIALVRFGGALNAVLQVGCLFFLRHLPSNCIESSSFLANRSVLNYLPNRKLKRHDCFFPCWAIHSRTPSWIRRRCVPQRRQGLIGFFAAGSTYALSRPGP